VFGFQLSWELDLFGRIRREHESALAFVLASEQGRRGILVTLIGDVASDYFLLRELDLQLEIGRRTLRLNDETVLYFQNRLDGGVQPARADRIRALRSEAAVAIPEIEQQIRSPSTPSRCCPAVLRRVDRWRSVPRAAAAADPAGLGVAPRTAARRAAGRTAAGRGQRGHRRGQGPVLSDDQPDRIPGGCQRRSRQPDGAGRFVVVHARAVPADLSGRAAAA
jgi:hypothetical protein